MAVYRNILIPTDGSRESVRAADAGIRLGKALGARVTALHIVADAHVSKLEAWAHQDKDFGANLGKTLEDRAVLMLETVRDLALKAGVPCTCHLVRGGAPHEEILKAAAEHECDLIVMASHRLGAETEVMLDGETIKVLTGGPVPVLVYQ
jgi:nucleotide-binding universal stress UspA family protein